MTDTPERIWAWPFKDWYHGGCSTAKVVAAGAKDVEYVRADLYDDLLEKVEIATKALDDIVVDDTWGLEHETYMRCRVALRQLKEKQMTKVNNKNVEGGPVDFSKSAENPNKMTVNIWLDQLSQPIVTQAKATYQKGDMFCIEWIDTDNNRRMVSKYPMMKLFRVVETY